MTTHLTATVEGGTLKLDQSLPFADQTRVRLVIEPISEESQPAAAWESLKARLSARPIHGFGKPFSRDELHERR